MPDPAGAVALVGVQGASDHLGDGGEPQPPLQERRDGNLVGGVQYDRQVRPTLQCPERQAEARESHQVWRLEGQRPASRQAARLASDRRR